MSFDNLGLGEELLKAVAEAGYSTPTPIQEKAIPIVLMGRDVLGCAQTGTGKTASFTLPMIEILASGQAKARMPRSLILEPTRELAAQVAENFEKYGKHHRLSMALLIGGTSMADQTAALDKGVDVLIATPGRLLDLFERGGLLLNDVRTLVIDEADRMLDMGFIPDVERIVSLIPKIRQTLFFSATMPPAIRKLADAFLMNPKEITVARPATTADTVTQGLLMMKNSGMGSHVQKEKREALRQLLQAENFKNAIIFCNRKRDVGVVYRSLERHGFNVGQLHGDMVQSSRMEVLSKFKNGDVDILVCSDVAARGLDIKEMSHVFNFDVPTHAEDYVHRIGRTGRAGNKGTAYTLATRDDAKYLDAIARTIGKPIPPINIDGTSNDGKKDAPAASEEKPRRDRNRDKGNKRDRDNSEKRSRPQRDEKSEKPRRDKKGRRRRDDDDGPDVPVKGLGDHVPAFLMRSSTAEPEKKPAAKKAPAKKKAAAKKNETSKAVKDDAKDEKPKKTTRRRTTKKKPKDEPLPDASEATATPEAVNEA